MTAYEMRISDWSSDVCSSDLTFIATSPLHMRVKLNKTPEEVLEAINASVSLARNLVPDVEWSAEDATRSDPDFLARAIEVAIKAGARTINLPDTVGYATPETYGRMFREMRERVPNRSEEHTSELQSLMRTSYAVFCLKKKKTK